MLSLVSLKEQLELSLCSDKYKDVVIVKLSACQNETELFSQRTEKEDLIFDCISFKYPYFVIVNCLLVFLFESRESNLKNYEYR